MKKEETRKNYKLTFSNGYYAQQTVVVGNYTKEEIQDIHKHIGRDFICSSINSGLNLKFFSNVITEETE